MPIAMPIGNSENHRFLPANLIEHCRSNHAFNSAISHLPSTSQSTFQSSENVFPSKLRSFGPSPSQIVGQLQVSRALCLETSIKKAQFVWKPWSLAMIPGGNPAGSSSTGPGSSSSISSSSSAPDNSFSIFSLLPANPNLGLFLLTPLVPAADNRPALALLTTVQFLFGLSMMTRRVPKFGESRLRHRATSALRFSAGSVAVFLSAFEALRLSIPYDPWAEEAKTWRRWAVKNGHNPSWWYGGIAFYRPMSITEWKVKTTTWISNLINTLESDKAAEDALEDAQKGDTDLLSNIPLGPRTILKAGEANTYQEIHENLFLKNCQESKDMLEGHLKDVTELNKAARLDALLENKSHVHLNEEYVKPNIQLGTHTMESDEEFEMVWANFEPWDELRQETDYDVRLIPRWRCTDELSSEPKVEFS